MPDAETLILYMYPAACTRVTISALEEAGLAYEDRMVNLGGGQQKSPDYLALNPKGKVPAIVMGGKVMTENAAILWFIHQSHPEAALLPQTGNLAEDIQGLMDLTWCSGTLHPIVRQVRAPARYTGGDTAGVRADGMAKFAHECEGFVERLSDGRWWYGSRWSIIDVYLYWCYSNAEKGGFPLADYPALVQHARPRSGAAQLPAWTTTRATGVGPERLEARLPTIGGHLRREHPSRRKWNLPYSAACRPAICGTGWSARLRAWSRRAAT